VASGGSRGVRGRSPQGALGRRDDIMQIAARHGARTVSVFGSVARGDAGPHSDLDLLVDTGDPQSLFEQAALQSDLEDLLGCPVHVLTTGGLSCARENTRAQIKCEAISL
jgi:predicted nucleotidyltransferase